MAPAEEGFRDVGEAETLAATREADVDVRRAEAALEEVTKKVEAEARIEVARGPPKDNGSKTTLRYRRTHRMRLTCPAVPTQIRPTCHRRSIRILLRRPCPLCQHRPVRSLWQHLRAT
jgi:hypothetical protein